MTDFFKEEKKEYMGVEIPDKLDSVVREAIDNSRARNKRGKRLQKRVMTIAVSVVIVFAAFVTGVNISPAFAETMKNVPLLGDLVRVTTIKTYTVSEDHYRADVQVPQLNSSDNQGVLNSLNEKYLEEDKAQYDQFMSEIASLKAVDSEANLGLNVSYEVKTDNDRIFSIGRYVLKTAGDSSTTIKYDTVDKVNHVLITLQSLFKDDSYVDAISNNIIEQMKEQMKDKDSGKIYFIKEASEVNPYLSLDDSELFKQIKPDQNFYINSDGKLVISFDSAEVAPAFMGTPEFVIPTAAISGILVGSDYIK